MARSWQNRPSAGRSHSNSSETSSLMVPSASATSRTRPRRPLQTLEQTRGVTGLYQREEAVIIPFASAAEAVAWCETEDCFDAEDIERHLAEAVEEA